MKIKNLLWLLLFISTSSLAWDIPIRYNYDGDTIMSKVDILPMPLNYISVRVIGIDAPEIHGKCKAEKDKAQKAKAFLKDLIGDATVMSVTNFKWDKYGGRIDADVTVNGKDVATEMLKSGNAVAYKGGARKSWCK